MTRTKFLLAAGLFCWSVFAQGPPDFSGTWKLNNNKSTQDGPADRVYTEVIQEAAKTVKVTTTAAGVVNELDGTYPIDGKWRSVHVSKDLYRFTRVSRESGTLVFEISDRDSKKETAKVMRYVRESWTRSPDGKVLTKFRRTAQTGKIVDQKYVFDKQ